MDYNWLWDLLSADLTGGRLQQQFLPGYRGQQGRAQLAKSRDYDETVKQAKAMASAKEMALREKANEEARIAYNASHNVAPMGGRSGVGAAIPRQISQGAFMLAPPQQQRPYPGQGAPVRPPIPKQAPMAAPTAPIAAPSVAQPQISPQDYYAMLKSGMFRMG